MTKSRTHPQVEGSAAEKILDRGHIMEDALLEQVEVVCEQVARLNAAQERQA